MAVTTITYLISVAQVDDTSNLYLQNNLAQWGNATAGLPKTTQFSITRQAAGSLPQPTMVLNWQPDFSGGLKAPNGWNGSDSFDFQVPFPVSDAAQTVAYQLELQSGRNPVATVQPGAGNSFLILEYRDPQPGPGAYSVKLTATITPKV